MNPGKIVRASAMNDRTLFRYKPDYRVPEFETALDWSAYPGAGGGFQGAVEMCNNNGECRKHTAGVMCPSFRITGNERDLTRGRANTLRLAISGQLGPDALASDEMLETMQLCVSCKGCRRECPTGVDMAKMKIEVLAAANKRRGLSLRDRLVAYMPRYAPFAARLAPLMNARNGVPMLAALMERATGLSAKRPLPRWRRDYFRAHASGSLPHPLTPFPRRGRVGGGGPIGERRVHPPLTPPRQGEGNPAALEVGHVALFADTFNTYFEPDNLHAAIAVLTHLGYRVTVLAAGAGERALCCGRTYLSAGLVEQARAEARRVLAAAAPILAQGGTVVGLEPSCLLTLRDEFISMLPGPEAERLASRSQLLEEFLAAEVAAGRIKGPIASHKATVLLHGHCHQKAFGAMPAIQTDPGPGRGPHRADDRIQLLRHGRRLRLRGGHAPGIHGDGRAVAAAGGAQGGAGCPDRRRRLLLPAPDPRRHRPHRPARLAHIVRCDRRHARLASALQRAAFTMTGNCAC